MSHTAISITSPHSPIKRIKTIEPSSLLHLANEILATIFSFLKCQENARVQIISKKLQGRFKNHNFRMLFSSLNERIFPPMQKGFFQTEFLDFVIKKSAPIAWREQFLKQLDEHAILDPYTDMKLTEDGKLIVCLVDHSTKNGKIYLINPDNPTFSKQISLGRVEVVESWQNDHSPLILQKDKNRDLFKYVNLQITLNKVIVDFYNNPLRILRLEKGGLTDIGMLEQNVEWGPAYVTPDSKKIVKLEASNTGIIIWDLESGKREGRIALPRRKFFSYWGIKPLVQSSQDSLFIVCQNTVWMLNCKTWQLDSFRKHYNITSFQLSPQGTQAIVGDTNPVGITHLSLYNLKEMQWKKKYLLNRYDIVNFLKFETEKKVLISKHNIYKREATTLLWDIELNTILTIGDVCRSSYYRNESFGSKEYYENLTLLENRIIYTYGDYIIVRDLKTLREVTHKHMSDSFSEIEISGIIVRKNGSIVTLDKKGNIHSFDPVYYISSTFQNLIDFRHRPLNSRTYSLRLRVRCLE